MHRATSLILASSSPRRRVLLNEAGFDFRVLSPAIDDRDLIPQRTPPDQWVASLAYLKARSTLGVLAKVTHTDEAARLTILAADTVCVHDGRMLGQPRDRHDARTMLHDMRNATHVTISGVCVLPEIPHDALVERASGRLLDLKRIILVDRTSVTVGSITDRAIEQYLDSDAWVGKAGAYNLSERIAAGWPLNWRGDPATVMGLPIQRVTSVLERFVRRSATLGRMGALPT